MKKKKDPTINLKNSYLSVSAGFIKGVVLQGREICLIVYFKVLFMSFFSPASSQNN